jgi:phage-related protein
MPRVHFRFYTDKGNIAPVIRWLDEQPERVQDKFIVAMNLLSAMGHEARRPLWAPLRDGVYELRVQHQNVHYRLLCFFHGRNVIVAAHGCTKKGPVDPADIHRAVVRMGLYKANPNAHTFVDTRQ